MSLLNMDEDEKEIYLKILSYIIALLLIYFLLNPKAGGMDAVLAIGLILISIIYAAALVLAETYLESVVGYIKALPSIIGLGEYRHKGAKGNSSISKIIFAFIYFVVILAPIPIIGYMYLDSQSILSRYERIMSVEYGIDRNFIGISLIAALAINLIFRFVLKSGKNEKPKKAEG